MPPSGVRHQRAETARHLAIIASVAGEAHAAAAVFELSGLEIAAEVFKLTSLRSHSCASSPRTATTRVVISLALAQIGETAA